MPNNRSTFAQTAIAEDGGTLLVSLELSLSKWLVTSLIGGGEKMSKRIIEAGDVPALLGLVGSLRGKAGKGTKGAVRVVTIQEAGRDGFWLHRLLQSEGIESYVVDPGSIPVPRKRRVAKSDGIDGETLLRTLLAWLRGEPRVCSMVKVPSAQEEDRRRLGREREALIKERTRLTNRIKSLLAVVGIRGFNPLRRDSRRQLETFKTRDGGCLPANLKHEFERTLDRIELLRDQIRTVEADRDAQAARNATAQSLLRLKGIGPELASGLWLECFFRTFLNRRQLGAYGGLVPTPWQSGQINHEQGISGAGNPRLRKMLIELAWLWLRHQRGSALSRWFIQRVGAQSGRIKRISIVALARKLLVALWHYVEEGIVPEGAVLKAA
jgi:transposase